MMQFPKPCYSIISSLTLQYQMMVIFYKKYNEVKIF